MLIIPDYLEMLPRDKIEKLLLEWYDAWNSHNLDDVMRLFRDDIVFVNWNGKKVKGKKALRKAWQPWFASHGGFRFSEQETFIDEVSQKVLFRWRLEWPSRIPGYEGLWEKRDGVDVLHFSEGKIIKKLTYSQTVVSVNGEGDISTDEVNQLFH